MEELLKRYSAEERSVINMFWDTIRWTRQTGKISDGIKKTEMEFWSGYDADIVIKALEIHIDRYSNIKEHYTRGIIKNLAAAQGQQAVQFYRDQSIQPQRKKSKFANYEQRQWDYESIEKLAHKKLLEE